jgi:hypothetical protein
MKDQTQASEWACARTGTSLPRPTLMNSRLAPRPHSSWNTGPAKQEVTAMLAMPRRTTATVATRSPMDAAQHMMVPPSSASGRPRMRPMAWKMETTSSAHTSIHATPPRNAMADTRPLVRAGRPRAGSSASAATTSAPRSSVSVTSSASPRRKMFWPAVKSRKGGAQNAMSAMCTGDTYPSLGSACTRAAGGSQTCGQTGMAAWMQEAQG